MKNEACEKPIGKIEGYNWPSAENYLVMDFVIWYRILTKETIS